MAEIASTPAPPAPAAVSPDVSGARPSQPPGKPAVPLVVQVLDKIFDGVALVLLYLLARYGLLGGELAAGLIVFVATGNNGIRALSQRAGGPALGVAGLALLAAGSVLGYAPIATAAVAVVTRGSPGYARMAAMAWWSVIGVAVAIACCHPRLPPVSGCAPFEQSCSPEGTPRVCSASRRWEPAGDVSCAAVGSVCGVSDAGIARCVPVTRDGGGL